MVSRHNLKTLSILLFCVLSSSLAAADNYKLQRGTKAPEKGVSAEISGVLDPATFQIHDESGVLCELWLVKTPDVKPNFASTFSIQYPLTPGQLLGVLRVPDKRRFKDFRGQELKPGVYTLRYGQQPEDGNHIGTSESGDFILALPAAHDQKKAVIQGFEKLSQHSAKAAGSTHPAIFALMPFEDDPVKKTALTHDPNTEFWILNVKSIGNGNGRKVYLPLRILIVGQSEA